MRLLEGYLGFKALKAAILIMAVLSFGALDAYSMPDAAHGIKGVSTKWRNHYRTATMVSLHKLDARGLLINHSSQDTAVNGAIELFMKGKWEDAVAVLRSGDTEVLPSGTSEVEPKGVIQPKGSGRDGEGLYVIGLMYEAVGFYPEALMSYVEIAWDSPYRKRASLRVLLQSFLSAVKSDSNANLLEFDKKIMAVADIQNDTDSRNEALAQRAYVLFSLGRHLEAEELFKKSGGRLEQNPFSLLIWAENRALINDYDGASSIFHKLEVLSEYTSDALLRSYVYLRLGDMAMIGKRYKDAESFYLKMPGELLRQRPAGRQAEGFEYRGKRDDAPLIKSMALSELYMMDKKSEQAIEILKGFVNADVPYGIGMDDNALFYLVRLSNESASFKDTLSYARIYNERFPQSLRKRNIMVEVELAVTNLITSAYKAHEYPAVIRFYNENINAIWKKEIYIMAAESFIALGFGDEAVRILERLVKLYGPFKDIGVPLNLAKAEIIRGNVDEAKKRLKTLKPASNEDDLAIAQTYQTLGGMYFKRERYKDALDAFAEAAKHINDPEMELKRARAFALSGQSDGA
ncbi:MAG: hypothetical protein HY880_08480, partial [Deltaproteobacteria bacterium]|nr:hypothetical protein [Deltaproteobacteria bacterium]